MQLVIQLLSTTDAIGNPTSDNNSSGMIQRKGGE